MDNEELLKKIADNSEKSLRFHRISAICLIGILCVVLVSACMVVPKAASALNSVDSAARTSEEALNNATKTLTEAAETLKKVNEMADSVTDTSDDINKFLNDNSETMLESLDKMSKIDFDGLNEGIKDLQDAVGPFAKFMSSFGR